MAHDGIGFELFMYLCSDWQIPQEIFLVMQAKGIKNGFLFIRNTIMLFTQGNIQKNKQSQKMSLLKAIETGIMAIEKKILCIFSKANKLWCIEGVLV